MRNRLADEVRGITAGNAQIRQHQDGPCGTARLEEFERRVTAREGMKIHFQTRISQIRLEQEMLVRIVIDQNDRHVPILSHVQPPRKTCLHPDRFPADLSAGIRSSAPLEGVEITAEIENSRQLVQRCP